MSRIRLICWQQEVIAERVPALKKSGFEVDASPLNIGGLIGHLRDSNPSVLLIDLDRRHSVGRELGIRVRNSSLRHLPIIYAGGDPEKVARLRLDLPDATYTDWAKAPTAIKSALKNAAKNPAPVQPTPYMQRFAGSNLAHKLDLKRGVKAVLIRTEEGFVESLGELAEGVELGSRVTSETKLVLWFIRSANELQAAFETAAGRMPEGCSLWIIYPKKAGKFKVDFNQNDVRHAGLAADMVDYKICAVDADWSGMKFARRRSK